MAQPEAKESDDVKSLDENPKDEPDDESDEKGISFDQMELTMCSCADIHNRLLFSWQTLAIDIRSEKEYLQSHIKKFINIPLDSDEQNVLESIDNALECLCKSQSMPIDLYFYSNKEMIEKKLDTKWYKYIQKMIAIKLKKEKEKEDAEDVPQYPWNRDNEEKYVFTSINVLDVDYQTFANKYKKLLNFDNSGQSDLVKKYPSIIIENKLLLGDSDNAEDKNVMIEYGITHILNITQLVDNEFENDKELNIKYLRYELSDSPDENIADKFNDCIQFIQDALNENDGDNKNTVLVHCFAGVSRSSSAVISYFMKTKNMSFDDAYHFVQSKRRIIDPNEGFVEQLKKWQQNGYKCIQ